MDPILNHEVPPDGQSPEINPYQAPRAPPSQLWPQLPPPYPAWSQQSRFEPLEAYVWIASIAIFLFVASGLVLDTVILLAVHHPLLQLLSALATLIHSFAFLMAGIFFLVWVHRAARNVQTLGRPGLHLTPGWCVGWFFVPVASLVMPYRALSQIWHASDPGIGLGIQFWRTTPLLPLWWGTYLASSLLTRSSALFASNLKVMGTVELIGNLLGAVAALSITLVMREVTTNQRKIASTS